MPYVPSVPLRKRGQVELGTLYGMSAAYGAGLGVWLSVELQLDDPGLFLIAPATLGVLAPVGVYVLDHPELPRGVPAATATGLFLGTAEAAGIVSLQYVHTSDANAWGFTQLVRATALGSTLGAAGGTLAGYALEPAPEVSLFVSSGALWGTALGSLFGYGATRADQDFAEANDPTSVAGFVGLNVGALGAAGLSLLWTPTARQIGTMWAGAGIGLAASLPVYLLYLGNDGPPARRGMIFSGTAMLLGIGVGGILGREGGAVASGPAPARQARLGKWLTLDALYPMPVESGFGVCMGGSFL